MNSFACDYVGKNGDDEIEDEADAEDEDEDEDDQDEDEGEDSDDSNDSNNDTDDSSDHEAPEQHKPSGIIARTIGEEHKDDALELKVDMRAFVKR